MAIKHTFVSAIADDPDSTLVRPSNWNADHTIDNDTITRAHMANYAARGSMTRGGVGGDVEDFAIGATGTYIRSDGTDPAFVALSIVDDTTPQLGGDLDVGTNKLKFTGILIKEEFNLLRARNLADTTDTGFISSSYATSFNNPNIIGNVDPGQINSGNVDDIATVFQARDNGVGLVEVARLQGAAEPTFEVARGGTYTFVSTKSVIIDGKKISSKRIQLEQSGGFKFLTEDAVASLTQRLLIGENAATVDISLTNADLNIGVNLLKTTNLALKESSTDLWVVRNAADNANRDLRARVFQVDSLIEGTDSSFDIDTQNADNAVLIFGAREDGVGTMEVARLQSAASPTIDLLKARLTGDLDTNASDILLKGNLLKTTNVALKELSSTLFAIRDDTDTGYLGIAAEEFQYNTDIRPFSISADFRTHNADDSVVIFEARDNGVGYVELGRLASGADPFFELKLAKLTGVLDVSTFDLAFETKAGAAVTGDFTSTTDGIAWILDTTNNRWYYIRAGGVHFLAETAGFQIPKEEIRCPDCKFTIMIGQRVIGRINQKLQDGGLHGLWVHEACAS